jgi:hypothetical protein
MKTVYYNTIYKGKSKTHELIMKHVQRDACLKVRWKIRNRIITITVLKLLSIGINLFDIKDILKQDCRCHIDVSVSLLE